MLKCTEPLLLCPVLTMQLVLAQETLKNIEGNMLSTLYLSSDEGEVKDELEEPFIMENGYEGDLPSPVIPSSLLEEQVKSFIDKKRTLNCMCYYWPLIIN